MRMGSRFRRTAEGVSGLLCAALFGVCSAIASPEPRIDVPALVEGADLIVVGHAGRASIRRDQERVTEFVSVAVDRVLNRAIAVPSQIMVQRDLLGGGNFGVRPATALRQYGIYFLRKTGSINIYVPVEPYHPALVASAHQRSDAPASDDITGQVAHEFALVLSQPAATSPDVRRTHELAAAGLKSIPYSKVYPHLRAIAASGQFPARLWAISCLLHTDGPNDFESQKARHLESVAPLLLDPRQEWEQAIADLAGSIERRVRSPKAVAALSTLLNSTDARLRAAAASALADMATASVIAPLARTALYDSEQGVRYQAVRGLAEATGAANVPTMALFQRLEDRVLRFWQQWAHENLR
jgi:hypothetical protein